MKQKILILCLCIFFIFSCTHFECTNEIITKVYIMGDAVGLEYKLGNLLVIDELDDLSASAMNYFKKCEGNIKLMLKIKYDDNSGVDSTAFIYYLKGIKLEENLDVVTAAVLLANRESIPNFLLFELESDVYDDPIQYKQNTNIKEDFKENKIEQPSEQVVQEPKTTNSRKL